MLRLRIKCRGTRGGDLDCSNFVGSVRVVAPDVYGLDDDGDGIGCEPGER